MDASLTILSALLVSVSGAPSGVFREAHLQPVPSQLALPALISPIARLISPAGLTSAAVYVIPIQSDDADQHLIGLQSPINPSKQLLSQSWTPVPHSLLRLSPLPTAVHPQAPEVFLLASPTNPELLPITSATGLRIPKHIAPAPLVHSVGSEPAAPIQGSGISTDGRSIAPGQAAHSSLPIAALSQQEQGSVLYPQSTVPNQQRSAPVPNLEDPIQGQHLTGNSPANSEKSSIQSPSTSNLEVALGQKIQPITSVFQKQLQTPDSPVQNQNVAKNQVLPAGSASELAQHSLNASPILNAPSTPLNPSGRSEAIQGSAPVPQESVVNVIPNAPGASSVETAKQALGNNEQINPNPISTPNI